jgi:4-aminobutyrate aminotransferase-like enzyme
MQQSLLKEKLFRKLLVHDAIVEIRGKGLMLAIMLKNSKLVNKIILIALERGLILFWLLFEKKAIRISPPLNISDKEIQKGCEIILNLLNEFKT